MRRTSKSISLGPDPFTFLLQCAVMGYVRRCCLNLAEKLYSFLKALLPIPKRRIPAPSRRKVPGQGKEKQKSVLMPANINIDSIISNTPAIIKSHFDAVNIGPSFCYNYIFIRCITCRLTGARAFFALPCPA